MCKQIGYFFFTQVGISGKCNKMKVVFLNFFKK